MALGGHWDGDGVWVAMGGIFVSISIALPNCLCGHPRGTDSKRRSANLVRDRVILDRSRGVRHL